MTQESARAALKKYFGYDAFRPLQATIIQHVYDGKDGIVLMPTGGGKSMCFQIPAVTMPGTAVVVSPLISLMKDQVDGLTAVGIRAGFLNSSQTGTENTAVEQAYENGELHLLYVSPEKLLSPGFFPFLRRRRVCLFAIDEAHCISAWGHDFRPEYTQLGQLKRAFPEVPILALTATADRLTRADMGQQLGIPEAEQFIASFNRPNLSLEVRPGRKRREQIIKFVRQRPGEAGIVYCLSRKQTETLAEKLREAGFVAEAYHAGLGAQHRARVQSDFIQDRVDIVVATVAFGMGIDKGNVRWVIHYTMPKNLENYYQEIGRAGRDGAAADTLLFYSYGDYMTLKDMLGNGEGGNGDIVMAKLDRMKEFAESLACRRRILLNYFSEDHAENCGNCDICANPPERFDGTVIAQKALSAVARLRESVGLNLTIDVLRGSHRREIAERGLDRIKTYGAGRDLSLNDWGYFFSQLINLGYVYVAHEDGNRLRLTEAARRVLFQGERVELVKFQVTQQRKKENEARTAKRAAAPRSRNNLFQVLRELRTELARQYGYPPYLIFSDKTLEEMAAAAPTDDLALGQISGVGERKLQRYGDRFLAAIREYRVANPEPEADPAAARATRERQVRTTLQQEERASHGDTPTHLVSYQAYVDGEDVAAVARRRGLKTTTILNHLARAYREGHDWDLLALLPDEALDFLDAARAALPEATTKSELLRWIAEHRREGVVNYGHFDLVDAYRSRHPVPAA